MTRFLLLSVQWILKNLHKIRIVVVHAGKRPLDTVDQSRKVLLRRGSLYSSQSEKKRKEITHHIRLSHRPRRSNRSLSGYFGGVYVGSITAAVWYAALASAGRPMRSRNCPQLMRSFGSGN